MSGVSLASLRTRLVRGMYRVRLFYYRTIWKMDLGENVRISLTAKLDKTNPRGVHIGDHTTLSFGAAILTHDFVNSRHVDTYIGANCFVGARSLIVAGVRIGDNCIVAAGTVVLKDVPAGCLVMGNPGRIMDSNVRTREYGIRLVEA